MPSSSPGPLQPWVETFLPVTLAEPDGRTVCPASGDLSQLLGVGAGYYILLFLRVILRHYLERVLVHFPASTAQVETHILHA